MSTTTGREKMDIEQLEKLYDQKDKGLISEEEFSRLRDALLNGQPPAEETAEVMDCSEAGCWKGSFLAFASAFKRWKDFKGRTTRFDYWGYGIVAAVVQTSLSSVLEKAPKEIEVVTALIAVLLSLCFLWIGTAVLIRRFHDVDMSGWWILTIVPVFFIPFFRSDKEAGRYGPLYKTNEKKAFRLILFCVILTVIPLLLIAAILGIGIAAGYSNAMYKYETTKTVDQVQTVSRNIQTLFQKAPNYNGVEDTRKMFESGVFETNLCVDENCTALKNAFGGRIAVKALTTGGFSLYYNNIPQNVCVNLVSYNWKATMNGFTGLVVNPEQGLSEKNLLTDFIPPEIAKEACSLPRNSISWLML